MKLSAQVQHLHAVTTHNRRRASWAAIAKNIPESVRKHDVQKWMDEDYSVTVMRLAGENLARLGCWLEGYEAAKGL